MELEIIVSHSLGHDVRPISEWLKFSMGYGQVFFLQMLPSFFLPPQTHVAPLFILCIGFIQNVMKLLVDVLNAFNKPSVIIIFRLNI